MRGLFVLDVYGQTFLPECTIDTYCVTSSDRYLGRSVWWRNHLLCMRSLKLLSWSFNFNFSCFSFARKLLMKGFQTCFLLFYRPNLKGKILASFVSFRSFICSFVRSFVRSWLIKSLIAKIYFFSQPQKGLLCTSEQKAFKGRSKILLVLQLHHLFGSFLRMHFA